MSASKGIAKLEKKLATWLADPKDGLIHLIYDYGAGDQATSEVAAAIMGHAPNGWRFKETNVGSFDTIETGFTLAQLGMQVVPHRPQKTIIFANCAPRKDRSAKRRNNEGEGLVVGLLKSGVYVIAVNSGHSLSFVRDSFEWFYATTISKSGSQFRSRDNFPKAVGMLLSGDLSFLGSKLNPKRVIEKAPDSVVGYVDSFGNLKTTIRSSSKLVRELKEGEPIRVFINGCYADAFVAKGSFNVAEGQFAFAPGSSGHDDRFWEVFRRGGSAEEHFNFPRKGAEVTIRGVSK